jgi:hypothetical protein
LKDDREISLSEGERLHLREECHSLNLQQTSNVLSDLLCWKKWILKKKLIKEYWKSQELLKVEFDE